MTNVSKVYFGLSLVRPGRGWPAGAPAWRTGGMPLTADGMTTLPGRACAAPLAGPEAGPRAAGWSPAKPSADGDVRAVNEPCSGRSPELAGPGRGSPGPGWPGGRLIAGCL